MTVQVRHDRQRGCGWRKPGGLYLISGQVAGACGALPVPLTRCPCCDAGIKPSRGWTWVQADALLNPERAPCGWQDMGRCARCAVAMITGRHGLLWIGEKFYPTPTDWLRESREQGVSRRLHAVPKDFKLGETWVLVAHRKAIRGDRDGLYTPGIFQLFRPTAVEYVVKGTETEEELKALEKRGITPVRVERQDAPLFAGATTTEGESSND